MRIVCISDTHGKTIPDDQLPFGDVLLHAGDVTNNGRLLQTQKMADWFVYLLDRYEHIVFTPGNHDFFFEAAYLEGAEDAVMERMFGSWQSRIHYLRDSGIMIGGKYFYGTPWTICGDWAFSEMDRDIRRDIFNRIPLYTNVLISHGPPYSILDRCDNGAHGYGSVGDLELLGAVDRVRPHVHCFGHIHDGFGVTKIGDTTFVNAAVTRVKPTEADPYPLQNPPIVVEI